MLSEISQAQKVQMPYESAYVRNVTKVVTSVETENSGCPGLVGGGMGSCCLLGTEFQFCQVSVLEKDGGACVTT